MKKYFKTIAIFVFIAFVALQSNIVKADSGVTLTKKTYVTYNGRTEAKFYTSKGYAWCITPERTGANQGHKFSYSYTENDGGLLYILDNASDTSDNGYLLTQLAVWKYRSNFMPDAFVGTTLGNKAAALAKTAKGKSNYTSKNISVKITADNNNIKASGEYYVISGMSIKFSGVDKYKVTISGAKDAELLNGSGNVVSNGTEFSTSEKFNVRVPIDKLTEKVELKVTISVSGTTTVIKRYSPNNNTLQDIVIPEKVKKTASDSVVFTLNPVKRVCEIYNGKYYGKDGKETTKVKYQQECETNICKIVGDKYYGKDGKETTKLKYQQECEENVCKIVGDKYFGRDGKETTKLKYEQECETNICKIVGDKYFGKDGLETTEADYKAQCETTVPDTGVSPLTSILSIILGAGLIGGTILVVKKYNKNN